MARHEKQARILSDKRIAQALAATQNTRERVILLLSIKAGLRAVEIAGLRWDDIDLEDNVLRLKTTKGHKPRQVPIAADLRQALLEHRENKDFPPSSKGHVLANTLSITTRCPVTPNAIQRWLGRYYSERMGWEGYSSHSGRRTFATRVAQRLADAGGSVKDLQALLGHEFLSSTQRYLDKNEEAQKKVVDLI